MKRMPRQMLPAGGRWQLACGLISWLIMSGCDSGVPQPVPVSGTVEYQGQPLTDGAVAFVPVVPAEGHAARGIIESDGYFKLTTFKKGDGAFPGDYKVTVFAYEEAEDMMGPFQGVGPSLIPERYNQASTTDLAETVQNRSTVVKLELED